MEVHRAYKLVSLLLPLALSVVSSTDHSPHQEPGVGKLLEKIRREPMNNQIQQKERSEEKRRKIH